MRLDKFVSQSLGTTRKQSKQLLRQQLIKVDGVVACRAEQHIDIDSVVTFEGRRLQPPGPL
ncbi:MAG TPA: 16S rRNA pseudouridine(516) synthase, partial [Candidatus Tenderia electrophaga]|nr:16S rRNA pseudouridine(516) synthase [Candidatus Tenderia electrophaga]